MKFHKALKFMIKNPHITLSSGNWGRQDLSTIKFWLTCDEVPEDERKLHFDRLIAENNWQIDEVQNGKKA